MMVLFSHWSFVPGVFQFCFFVILERNMKHGIFFFTHDSFSLSCDFAEFGQQLFHLPTGDSPIPADRQAQGRTLGWPDPFAGLKVDANPSTTSRIKESDRIGYSWQLSDKH